MSTPYYCVTMPLSSDSDLTTAALAFRLGLRLPEYNVSHHDNRINVAIDDWSLSIWLSKENWVNIEANEMADMHPDWPELERLRDSSKRLELSSYCDDSGMEHFNTYLFILEEIDKFKGVLFKFDPRDGELI